MPTVITRTVYTYDELTPTAQEKARDWFRSTSDGSDMESVYEDAAEIADILGIDLRQTRKSHTDGTHSYVPTIYYSGFWSQGDGACFVGTYGYKKGAAKAIRAYAPEDAELHRIADSLQKLQRQHFYRLTAKMNHSGHYYHSGCMWVEVESYNDSRELPENDVAQLMRDFADWIYSQLEKAYEWENADEQVSENIRINEYTFNESGTREE